MKTKAWIALSIGLAVSFSALAADEQKPADAEAQKPAKKIESSNPLSGDADAIELGRRLFGDWCSVCHGIHANGESRFGKYAANLTKFWRGYKEFIQIVKNGRTGQVGMMPPFGKAPDYLVLDDDSINKIGAFLETLAEEGAIWK
jgi:mono/diheme cytochrome c family protein